VYWAEEEYVQLDDPIVVIVNRCSVTGRDLSPIISGIALCMLAKHERRYPDTSLGARRVLFGSGVLIFIVGLLKASMRYGLGRALPRSIRYTIYQVTSVPWISIVIAILACTYAADIGKRGDSRRLIRLSQAPIYPIAFGVVAWIFSLERLFWPLRSTVWDCVFPLLMIIMLSLTVHVLRRNAREADANWTTD
jgi:hypothetical protein